MANENVNQVWVSYLEAQLFSGLSQGTLRRLVRADQLRGTKIGRSNKIDKHSLEDYMRNHGYAEQLRLFD